LEFGGGEERMTGQMDVNSTRIEKVGKEKYLNSPRIYSWDLVEVEEVVRDGGKRSMAYRGLFVSALDRRMVGEFC